MKSVVLMVLELWYAINKYFFNFFKCLTIFEPVLHIRTKNANQSKTDTSAKLNKKYNILRNQGHWIIFMHAEAQ